MTWETFSKSFMEWLPKAGIGLAKILLIFFVGWLVMKFGLSLFRKFLHKTKLDMAVISFILSTTKAIVIVIIVLLALDVINLPITAITASLGAFSVGITIALKDTMSSLASGLNIIVNKPFKNGDYVEVAGFEGTISEIRMMSTKLISADNKTIIIPNNVVNSSAVINYTNQKERRIDIIMSIAYDSDIKLAKQVIQQTLENEKRVLVDNGITIGIDNFADSSVNMIIRFWVDVKDYWNVEREIKESLFVAFKDNNIDIPFNQLDINLKDIEKKEFKISNIDKKINEKIEKGALKEKKYHDKLK